MTWAWEVQSSVYIERSYDFCVLILCLIPFRAIGRYSDDLASSPLYEDYALTSDYPTSSSSVVTKLSFLVLHLQELCSNLELLGDEDLAPLCLALDVTCRQTQRGEMEDRNSGHHILEGLKTKRWNSRHRASEGVKTKRWNNYDLCKDRCTAKKDSGSHYGCLVTCSHSLLPPQ